VISLNTYDSNSEKQTLMVFPLDLAAHYLRCLELCKKLRAQFEIFFTYSPKYDRFVKKYGFETFRVANFNSEEISAARSTNNSSETTNAQRNPRKSTRKKYEFTPGTK
jgi:UDP:flavonoid glycosyltransferase YjiC (YdhE family)